MTLEQHCEGRVPAAYGELLLDAVWHGAVAAKLRAAHLRYRADWCRVPDRPGGATPDPFHEPPIASARQPLTWFGCGPASGPYHPL